MPFTQEELERIADKAVPFYLARMPPPEHYAWWRSGYRLFLRALKSGYGLFFAALITLHQPDGRQVYVNPEEIQIVAPAGGVYPGKTRLLVHDQWIAVMETPEQVKYARDGE